MKKSVLFFVFVFFVTFVFAKKTKWEFIYVINLQEVIIGDSIISINDTNSKFENENIKFNLVLLDFFYFNIENKTKFPLYINWDNIVYTDFYKNANNLIHSEVKYIDINKPQGTTVLPMNSSITDILVPKNNIYYNESSGFPGLEIIMGYEQGWQIASILQTKVKDIETRNLLVNNNIGKQFSIYFPLTDHNGKTIHITYVYKITEILVTQSKPKSQFTVKKIEDFPN